MILKGNERGNGRELANHLMRGAENEHIELHNLRGFASDDLFGAMQESEAIAKGTRCRKHLFSLSLSPPQEEDVPVEVFELAIGEIERELGLEGQPRAIVFHEKEGRRHAHAVWSRIDGEEMKALNLPFYKRRLNEIARELYLEHGWELPKGFRDQRQRDPLGFTRDEWQQAKRTKQDPKAIKQVLQECWGGSDTREAFEAALRERGYFLARGDRRGYVAVDWRGEIYSLSRSTGAGAKDLRTRLGDPRTLPSADEAKARIAGKMTPKLLAWVKEEQAKAEKTGLASQFQREQMVQRHRQVRQQLKNDQQERWLGEERKRAERSPRGLKGLWGWVTGRNRKIRQETEAEIARAQTRDRAEKQSIVARQLAERRNLQRQIKAARQRQTERLQDLNHDVARYLEMGAAAPVPAEQSKQNQKQRGARETSRQPDRGRDPGIEPH